MGDRKGLTKLDRTNGFDDGLDYMRVKKTKLAQQNDEIRDALRSRNATCRTDIFKSISIYVNGRTQPTADELKRLILLNGGEYHPYYRYKTTNFMIATNLSIARVKTLRPDDIVIRPEWITDSVEVKCLLPYEDYQLFTDEVAAPDTTAPSLSSFYKQSTNQHSFTTSKSINVKKSTQQQQHKKESKNMDIRDMFARVVRSADSNQCSNRKKEAPVITL